MHRSRLGTIVIDCQGENLDAATAFWASALGVAARRFDKPRFENYRRLEMPRGQPAAMTQKVDHPSHVHFDIETDDVEAEVARLEKLGAKRFRKMDDWWIMEAPSGHRFCVAQPQREDFPAGANEWP